MIERSAWILAGVLIASSAIADPASEATACIGAYEQAQELRQQNRLLDARRELAVCSARSCPRETTADCVRWSAEVEALIPSVTVVVRHAGGEAAPRAAVRVDGRLAAGWPLELDPGTHAVECSAALAPPTRLTVEVAARDKGRSIACVVQEPPSRSSSFGPEVYVAGGVGVAGLVIGTIVGVKGIADRADLADTCGKHCTEAQVGSVRTTLAVADVAIGVGVAGLGVAAALLLFRHPAPARAARLGSFYF